MKYSYEIIRSKRKTLSLEIKSDGNIVVRAPLRLKQREIENFVESKSDWLEKHIKRIRTADYSIHPVGKLSENELKELTEKASEYIPERVRYYSEIISVSYNKIRIKTLRSKWGSCSRNGNLSFNCLLMLAPPEVIDAIVVHELCHRLEMNHSKAFYDRVLSVCPDYKTHNKWLKEHSEQIIARLPEK